MDQRDDAREAERASVLEHGASSFGGEAPTPVVGVEEVDDFYLGLRLHRLLDQPAVAHMGSGRPLDDGAEPVVRRSQSEVVVEAPLEHLRGRYAAGVAAHARIAPDRLCRVEVARSGERITSRSVSMRTGRSVTRRPASCPRAFRLAQGVMRPSAESLPGSGMPSPMASIASWSAARSSRRCARATAYLRRMKLMRSARQVSAASSA